MTIGDGPHLVELRLCPRHPDIYARPGQCPLCEYARRTHIEQLSLMRRRKETP